MPGNCTTDEIFALKVQSEKFQEGQKNCIGSLLMLKGSIIGYHEMKYGSAWDRQTGAKVKDIKVNQEMYMNCEAVEPCALG